MKIVKSAVFEDGSGVVMARLLGWGGIAINQATLSLASYIAFDAQTETETAGGALVIASTVFNSLQTGDPRWDVDDIGFNFLHIPPASAFPGGAKLYRVEYKLTPVTGEVIWFDVELSTRRRLTP